MWLHLGGSYWQRASWDAIVVLVSLFALLAFTPRRDALRGRHVATFVSLAIAAGLFFALLARSLSYAEQIITPRLLEIESRGPS